MLVLLNRMTSICLRVWLFLLYLSTYFRRPNYLDGMSRNLEMNRYNKEFGRLVRHLRERHERMGQAWTQQQLALETDGALDVKQIGRIERGEVILDSKLHLEVLSEALRLTELQKVEFYAAGGFLYRPGEKTDYRQLIDKLLGQHCFPSLLTTPLADIVAFNAYYQVLYGHTPAHIHAMRTGSLGANTLRIFLDDTFERKVYRGGLEGWQKALKRSVYLFKISSLRYVTTERYHQIVNGLRKLYQPEFDYFWRLAEIGMSGPHETVIDPTIKIHHPEFGAMSFMVLRIPQDFIGQQAFCSVFLPLNHDQPNYDRLIRTVSENHLTVFDAPEFGVKS